MWCGVVWCGVVCVCLCGVEWQPANQFVVGWLVSGRLWQCVEAVAQCGKHAGYSKPPPRLTAPTLPLPASYLLLAAVPRPLQRASLEARQQDIRDKQLAVQQSGEYVEKLKVGWAGVAGVAGVGRRRGSGKRKGRGDSLSA